MNQIQTDALDFEDIKSNLRLFLSSQVEFDSYDFQGSALNMLLDVLAYNTHYNALYTNLAVNESFLDSASKRSSVVSLAKNLGYTAKSTRSARAKVVVDITLPLSDTRTALTIPRGMVFNGTAGENNYIFTTLTDYSARINNGIFSFVDVYLTQGAIETATYVAKDDATYVIPSRSVDTTTISVFVREHSSSSVSTRFVQAADVTSSKSTDNVYYIKQREDLFYEVYFGNGTLGAAIKSGNVVRIEYLSSVGAQANSTQNFSYQSGYNEAAGIETTTVQFATGGTEEESIDSIRYMAPRAWVTQNRAVTLADYETVLLANYSTIESIHTWSGQDNVPRTYGKIYISAKPYNALRFSDSEKLEMTRFLTSRKGIVSVTPVFVDPAFMNVELTCSVYYNANTLRRTAGELETLVKNKIQEYSATLNKFDSVFRYSKISSLIDQVDAGVVSNSIAFRVRVPVDAKFSVSSKYSVVTDNPITASSVYTTRFHVPELTERCYAKDANGILQLYREDEFGVPYYVRDIGKVDYVSGTITIDSLEISSLHDAAFEFVFTPKSNDVVSNRNLIVTLPYETLTVNAISDKIASGETTGGNAFIFSTVR